MKEYYERPTQVIFIEEEDLLNCGPDGVNWCTGVVYRDEVICDCCGGTIYLDEVAYIYEFAYWYDKMDYNVREALNEKVIANIESEIREIYDWITEDIEE